MRELCLNKLRKNSLKLTPKRKAIIDFFLNNKRYLTPEYIWKCLKKEHNSLGLPSIYRNLEIFSKCGILVKVQRPDRRLYYGICSERGGVHHHHIICIKCGKVGEFFDCALMERKSMNGFKIVSHFLQIEGICSACE